MSISPTNDPQLTQITPIFPEVSDTLLNQMSLKEVILGESLLTPGLQTSVVVNSYHQELPIKNLDEFKNTPVIIELERPILEAFDLPTKMTISQVVYRMDNRRRINNNTEEFTLRICDQTMFNDLKNLVSGPYFKNKTPSYVTEYVLRNCAGAKVEIEKSAPARDYLPDNIHPFQVVAQQAQVALANGNDPSFVHYMTYENLGTHHFKSLYTLTKQSPIITLKFAETHANEGHKDPYNMIAYSFPCDFDVLSDLLNGIDENGKNISTGFTVNPLTKQYSMFGSGNSSGCGIGQGVPKIAVSNEGSAKNQNASSDHAKTYLQLRQARMSLLEPDKTGIRITVPWAPIYHAGKVVMVEINNKNDPSKLNYGSGLYLIVSMTHNIKLGGFSTTTLDCVAKTVGDGGVL